MEEREARTADRLALPGLLLAAAALRFAGIAHHLARAGPEYDERTIFIEPVLRMWRTGSLDPTIYTGYAGFFNHLIAVPVALGLGLGAETGAAVAARAVVAGFGVLSVALVHGLARHHAGRGAGLLAAALLAVSPLEVRSAHYVTPDVLVGTAMLAALLVLARWPAGRAEVIAGGLLGAATAIKYTGLLLAPAIASDLLTRRRARGWWRVALAAAVAFAACAPFALLQLHRQGSELTWAFQSYYGRDTSANRFAQGDASAAAAPVWIVAGALGPVGCALAAAALLLFRPRWALVPPLTVVIAAFLALLPANLVYPRHLVPVAVVTPLLAAAGWRALGDLLPTGRVRDAVLAILILAAVAAPAAASARLVERYLRTPAVDRAAEWIEGHVQAPARVVVTMDRLALDPSRFEVRTVPSLRDLPREAVRRFDLVLATSREIEGWPGFERVEGFESEERNAGLDLVALRPVDDRPASMTLPDQLQASPGQADPATAWDADPASVWRAAGPAWIDARWNAAVDVDRVEVEVGPEPDAWPQDLALFGSEDGKSFEEIGAFPLRPNRPARQRRGGAHGQIYVLTPSRPLRALRIERRQGGPWSLAAVRVFALTGRSRSSPSPAAN